MKNAFPYRIVVEWSDEDKAFIARVPALHGCAAHGPSPEAATREVRKAAKSVMQVLQEDGDAMPPSDVSADYSGQVRLRMPRSLHGRLSRMADAEGVSLNQMMVTLLASRAAQSFTALGRSGKRHTARQAEEILKHEWSRVRDR